MLFLALPFCSTLLRLYHVLFIVLVGLNTHGSFWARIFEQLDWIMVDHVGIC